MKNPYKRGWDDAIAHCVEIARKESEAPDPMPAVFNSIRMEDAIRAAIRATKKNIIEKILS